MKKYVLVLMLLILSSTSLFAKSRTKIILEASNTISFNQKFSMSYISKIQSEILEKNSNLEKGLPLYLVLNTPGGSVTAGNSLIDFIKALDREVHTITLFAASMGYHVVQSLNTRYITNSGELMSHRASIGGLSGQIEGEVEVRLNYVKRIVNLLDKNAAKRVGKTLSKYKNSIRDELWLVGQESVDKGHADEVADVTCGSSLKGTRVQQMRTTFGNLNLEFSNCPLIRYPISVKNKTKTIPMSRILDLYKKEKQDITFTL